MGKGGNQQVAALPWRRNRRGDIDILLITSRETKRWVIPKGWPMEGLKDFTAAKREAFEEAGIDGHVTREPLGHYTYLKRRKSGEAPEVRVTVYALEVKALLDRWPEKGERKRKWFSIADAAKAVHEPELSALIMASGEGH
jgi:8-oxo-dGTP pyrophosphatase MutT (NUDIX family)